MFSCIEVVYSHLTVVAALFLIPHISLQLKDSGVPCMDIYIYIYIYKMLFLEL